LLKQIARTFVLSTSLLALGSIALAQNPTPVPRDNTAVNTRDRAPDAMTAGQQSNSKSDLELTAEIRRAVVKDDSLSMLAHNVKIVSTNGNVVLRGPVNTEAEKASIASKAQTIAGVGKVDNQLEVKSQ
jgi:osmotically-inducible protein OsmY